MHSLHYVIVWLTYIGILLVLNLFLIIFAYPRWGTKIPFISITINASFASVAVVGALGIGYCSLQFLFSWRPSNVQRSYNGRAAVV